MSSLPERKRLILLQGELHRAVITLERLHCQARIDTLTVNVRAHGWWWMGGAAVAGLLLLSRLGGVVRWLPAALTIVRVARSFAK